MGDKRPFDKIGYWSELKLEIIHKYAAAYTRIMSNQKAIRAYGYVDAFSGPGVHVSRATGQPVAGSPLNALMVQPPFSEYHFIDCDPKKAGYLQQLVQTYFAAAANVRVYEADCNRVLLDHVIPRFQYPDFRRALCLLDPYGIDVTWDVIAATGRSRAIEIFLNFAIMDANRNVLWRQREGVNPGQVARMDRIWGDDSWVGAAYRTRDGLFGPVEEKAPGYEIAQAFRSRLLEVAGFAHVADPLPMRNSKGNVIYYLFFASPKAVAADIVADIFAKYRDRRE